MVVVGVVHERAGAVSADFLKMTAPTLLRVRGVPVVRTVGSESEDDWLKFESLRTPRGVVDLLGLRSVEVLD